jgi:hypothetical protein
MKLNTNIKVTLNQKSKIHKVNIVKESPASQAHKLYCTDLSVMRLRWCFISAG